MYIESVLNSDGTPVPHVEGKLHYPLAHYLIWLRKTPMEKGGYREPTTISNVFKHLKIWFDFCFDQNISFDMVTYELHLQPLKKLLASKGVQPQSINGYYRSWRGFYEWCEGHGISTVIKFPPKIEGKSSFTGQSRNFRSRGTARALQIDPGLETVATVLDYKDYILNMDEYARFSEILAEVDPVYSSISYMMVTTGLRIGGVMQIPLGSDKLNPRWLRYPELEASGAAIQKLKYLPKGNKRVLNCIVPAAALKKIHYDYIVGHRKARAKIFSERFRSQIAPFWLTASGKSVEKNDIWEAFKEASKKFGRRVVPHHMRHTYATYIVYNYFKAHGLTPNLAYANDIHEALRAQLGHSDFEVTKRYIRTVIRTHTDIWLPKLTPHLGEVVHREMPSEVLAAVIEFFEPHSNQGEE
ncbi:hypothetical protein PPTS312_44500 [Pseudomonas putida]|uniref:Site-specific integrase n=1 Tax=Pseudomonas putida TaxID=303 RepID=A0A7U6M615_PSEPU|nr:MULTISPECIES: site-specific integrase [Pseudomonas putida group]MDD2125724.1 site-specific integrase [Pseudomonas monteilii]BBU46535.1 hypothetical protein PPTS312_44500 [Pseudomonas putida]